MTYSLNHYLNAVTADGQAREISLLEISQTYGLTEKLPASASQLYQVVGPDESRFSEVHSRFTLFPRSTFWFVHDDYWSVSGKGLQDMTNSIHYAVPPGFQVDMSHSYVPGVADQMWVNTTVRWRVFDVNYQILYDLMQRTWDNALVSLTYHPSCWGVTFTVQETRIPRPSDTSFHVSFNLQGITQKIGGY